VAAPRFGAAAARCGGSCWQETVNGIYGSIGALAAIPANRVSGLTNATLLTCMTLVTNMLMSDESTTNIQSNGVNMVTPTATGTLMLPTYYRIDAPSIGAPSPQGFTIAKYPNSSIPSSLTVVNGDQSAPLSLPSTASLRNIGAMSSAASGAGGVPATRLPATNAADNVAFPATGYCNTSVAGFPCTPPDSTLQWTWPIMENTVCSFSGANTDENTYVAPSPPVAGGSSAVTYTQKVTWPNLNVADYTGAVKSSFESAYVATLGVSEVGMTVTSTVEAARRAASVTYAVLPPVGASENLLSELKKGQNALAADTSNLQSATTTKLLASGASTTLAGGNVIAQPPVISGGSSSSSSQTTNIAMVCSIVAALLCVGIIIGVSVYGGGNGGGGGPSGATAPTTHMVGEAYVPSMGDTAVMAVVKDDSDLVRL